LHCSDSAGEIRRPLAALRPGSRDLDVEAAHSRICVTVAIWRGLGQEMILHNNFGSMRFCFLIAAATCFLVSCRSTPPPPAKTPAVSADTWATVEGHDITREEVDKAYR